MKNTETAEIVVTTQRCHNLMRIFCMMVESAAIVDMSAAVY